MGRYNTGAMNRSARLLALALLALPCVSAFAGSLTYYGDTTGGPNFYRPQPGTPPVGQSSQYVAYRQIFFEVDIDGDYSFLSQGLVGTYVDPQDPTATPTFRNADFLYEGSLAPANLRYGKYSFAPFDTSAFTYTLTAGTVYSFVTTGYTSDDFGTFRNTISGPGRVIPQTPGPVALASFGMGALGCRLRRRKWA